MPVWRFVEIPTSDSAIVLSAARGARSVRLRQRKVALTAYKIDWWTSVHETSGDLRELQGLLDRTYASAGPHLLEIVTPNQRLSATQLCEQLHGLCLLSLATVSRDGRPFVGPVDSIFFRGHFYFSTGDKAVRWRHLQRDPHVSATYIPKETFATTVHGRVTKIDHHVAENQDFVDSLLDTFVPMYGKGFADFIESIPCYFRIEADKQYCYFRND